MHTDALVRFHVSKWVPWFSLGVNLVLLLPSQTVELCYKVDVLERQLQYLC